MTTRFYCFHIAAICILGALTVQPLHAQEDSMPDTTLGKGEMRVVPPGVDILPARSLSTNELSVIDPDSPTHPELRITPDKSEIVRLDATAGTVIVGNPAHISVLAENDKTLVVVPKAPGATYFTVMDAEGTIIMQRHVIVATPKDKYVRIRRSCASAEGECQTTQIYYCPDMCHEIILNPEAPQSGGNPMEATLAGQQRAGGGAPGGHGSTEVGSDAAGAAQ